MSDSATPVKIDDLLAHRPWARRLAQRLASDANTADDIEQETWLVALRRPPRHAGSPKGWLGAVVSNFARLAARRGRRRGRHESAVSPRTNLPAPEEAAAAAEVQSTLARAVLELDEPYRSTVLLRYFEGLEATEVAARLGVPVETVRTRVKRAIAQLRERLGPESDRRTWAWLMAASTATAPAAERRRRVGTSASRATLAIAGGWWIAGFVTGTAVLLLLLSGARLEPRTDVADDELASSEATTRETRVGPMRSPRAPRTSGHSPADRVADAPTTVSARELDASRPDAMSTLRVAVVTTDGTPVVGIAVRMEAVGHPPQSGLTADDGTWTCDRPDVEARVIVHVEQANGGRWYLESETTARPTDVEARLVLVEAGLVRGRIAGPDDESLPLIELDVQIEGARVFRSNSDESGKFVARAPLGRVADLVLTGQQYQRWQGKDFAMQTATSSPWVGELRGVAAGAIEVVLRASPAPQDAELDVVAVGPDGAPVMGVAIVAGRDGSWWDYAAIFESERRVTNSAGRLHLTGLDRRKIHVGASLPDSAGRSLDWLAPLEQEVVARGQEVRLAFRPAAVVSGVVVSPFGGPAVALHLQLRADADGTDGPVLADAATDAHGAFRFRFPPETPGPLRIDVQPAPQSDSAAGESKSTASATARKVAPGASELKITFAER